MSVSAPHGLPADRMRNRHTGAHMRPSQSNSGCLRLIVIIISTGKAAFGFVQSSPAAESWELLDFGGPSLQKQCQVFPVQTNFYARWRVERGVVALLREDRDSPPEHLLQSIWQHQRLLRDRLKTLDGLTVRVLHPGFQSLEGGPDFRGAVVQLGDAPPRAGDVEVDLRSSGWRAHGHNRNPAFANVILHVIWAGDHPADGAPPTLPLQQTLDAPLGELSLWLGGEAVQAFPEQARGKCCASLRCMETDRLTALLHEAAQVRLQSKASQFQARARQVGWEQSLWEGLFRALGYKHNTWPMQHLAELRPRWSARRDGKLAFQARFFGLSGLLPLELTRSQSATDSYLKRVWDHWWRERDEFSDCLLPQALWNLHGLRPANHPQRRVALASLWALDGNIAGKLERWCGLDLPQTALESSLLETLQVEPDDFWSWHCTFRSARLKKAQPLLGAARATDLAVNVVLPWLWSRAVEGKNEKARCGLEHHYFRWPAAEDNAVLRLARQRLLGGTPRRVLTGAAAQQGLIQIVRDFCDHSNALCENCNLPELVEAWLGRG